jgi:hypothetical protein
VIRQSFLFVRKSEWVLEVGNVIKSLVTVGNGVPGQLSGTPIRELRAFLTSSTPPGGRASAPVAVVRSNALATPTGLAFAVTGTTR